MKPFVGIKRLWDVDPIGTDLTAAALKALLNSANEIKNSHEGTFQYTQDDPAVTDYINELTGQIYYRDPTTKGARTIAFTMGEFDFAAKARLQGGSVINSGDGWKDSSAPQNIYRGIIAQTKSGNYVVFTNASIIAKTAAAEKNLGLGVTAVAMENPTAGVAAEYWFDGDKVDQ